MDCTTSPASFTMSGVSRCMAAGSESTFALELASGVPGVWLFINVDVSMLAISLGSQESRDATYTSQGHYGVNSRRCHRLNQQLLHPVSRHKPLGLAELAAIGASGVGLDALLEGAARRRKRKKKRPVVEADICTPGKVIANLPFSATGQTITSPILTHQDEPLEMSVNGGTPDLWSYHNLGHQYGPMYIGFGVTATFRCTHPELIDNGGSIAVTVECA